MNRALVQRSNNRQYSAAQGPAAQRRKDHLEDPSLAPAARRRVVAADEADMQERFAGFKQSAAGLLAPQRKEHALAQHWAQIAAEITRNPSQAAAWLHVYGAASGPLKVRLAQVAVTEGDILSAWAATRVLDSDPSLSDADQVVIGSAAASLTASKARQADADLYALQVEIGRLDLCGWQGDEVSLDGKRAMEVANAAATLPREDGGVVMVSDAEAKDLLALAGMPADGA